eukprot:986612-Amorphochlora_amoeboformis.AAC.1
MLRLARLVASGLRSCKPTTSRNERLAAKWTEYEIHTSVFGIILLDRVDLVPGHVQVYDGSLWLVFSSLPIVKLTCDPHKTF